MAKKRRKFKYQPTDSAANRKVAEGGGMYDQFLKEGIRVFKPRQGKNRVRILPATWEEAQHWGYRVMFHSNIGPDRARYLCLRSNEEDCPLCEEYELAKRDEDEEYAAKLRPYWQVACFIVDRNEEDAGPQLYLMSKTVLKEVCNRSEDEDTGETLQITEPYKEGYDISFKRAGEGLKTGYDTVNLSPRPKPLCADTEVTEDWLEFVTENPIPDILQFYEADYLDKLLHGKPTKSDADDVDDDDEDDDEPPKRSGRAADEPDDFEDDGDEDDDDADEEEDPPVSKAVGRRSSKPSSRGKTRSRLKDTEDEDAEEEGDDPPPSSRRSRIRAGLKNRS